MRYELAIHATKINNCMKFNILVEKILSKNMNSDNWESTSWSHTVDGEMITVTIKDMLECIKDRSVQEIKTKELVPYALHKAKTDKQTLDNIEKSNLQYPIIVLQHPDKYQILDGHHRLQKAINNKLPTIKARIINLHDLPEKWQKVFR